MMERGGPGWYYTAYRVRGDEVVRSRSLAATEYGSEIWARSYRHARAIAKRRGIFETVISPYPSRRPMTVPPSKLLARRNVDPAAVMHAACFVGWLASHAGVTTGTQLLADKGLIHELSHHFVMPDEPLIPSRRELIERLRQLERKVPGYLAGKP